MAVSFAEEAAAAQKEVLLAKGQTSAIINTTWHVAYAENIAKDGSRLC